MITVLSDRQLVTSCLLQAAQLNCLTSFKISVLVWHIARLTTSQLEVQTLERADTTVLSFTANADLSK